MARLDYLVIRSSLLLIVIVIWCPDCTSCPTKIPEIMHHVKNVVVKVKSVVTKVANATFKFIKRRYKTKYKSVNTKVVVTKSVSSFIGCFKAGSEVRDLPNFAGASADNSPNNCNDRCRAMQKKFFALHNSRECWCGNSFGNFNPSGPDSPVECHLTCPGNRKEKCGSETHNSVYNTTIMHVKKWEEETMYEEHPALVKAGQQSSGKSKTKGSESGDTSKESEPAAETPKASEAST